MIYLPYTLVEKSKTYSVTLSRYVDVIRSHGVAGFEKKYFYDMLRNFLISNSIPHCCNDRNIVWLPQLDEGIQEILQSETVTIKT